MSRPAVVRSVQETHADEPGVFALVYRLDDHPLMSRLPRGPQRALLPRQRPAALRDVRAVPVPSGTLFPDQVRFAWLTTQDLTPANAAQMHAVALDLLHFSPEPRVIEKVVDGAQALGRVDEAAWHQQRYRIAYPADFARWQARRASAASAAGAQ